MVQQTKSIMEIIEKYKMALLQLQEYSSNELIIVEGVELNIAQELESIDTDKQKARLLELLGTFKPNTEIPLQDYNRDSEGGISAGSYSDTIATLKCDGTYIIWNTPDADTKAFDETFHIKDEDDYKRLDSMIQSTEKFIKENFKQKA